MAIVWCVPKKGGFGKSVDYAIRLAVNKQGAERGKNVRKAVAIYISSGLACEMGWLLGDLIKVGFDLKERVIVLQRANKDGGFKLQPSGKANSKSSIKFCMTKFPEGIASHDLLIANSRELSIHELVINKNEHSIQFSFDYKEVQ